VTRRTTPSFVAEFPLRTTAADERTLVSRLDAQRNVYNAALGETLRRLGLMRQSRDWQRARAMPKTLGKDSKGKPIPNRERALLFRAVQERLAFSPASIQKFCEACRDSCWIGDHAGSHDTQATSLRAFKAVQQHAFGKRGRPRFKAPGRLNSVEGKTDAVIRYRAEPVPAVHWDGLVLPLRLDRKDRRGWQEAALSCRTKYVRVLRRTVRGKVRWFCQLVQEGEAPRLHETKEGVVGLDLGPSTIAAVAESDAVLEGFCPEVVQPWAESRRILRAMDRSRRATNPGNYAPDGTVKPMAARKHWVRSERYKVRQRKLAEAERRLAARRKQSHGSLVNRLLAQGTTIKTEKLSYKSFQRNFGRSVKVRAPGMFIDMVRRKAAGAGGGLVEIETRGTRLSQFDHTTGSYVRKPLSQRIHVFGDGRTGPVQRDLYSACLARHCDRVSLDVSRVLETWTAAEPLLRRAASGVLEPASGKGFARPRLLGQAPGRVGAGRPSKGDGCLREAGDAVATGVAQATREARAPESAGTGTPGTPWL
jgi:hypothetical protein